MKLVHSAYIFGPLDPYGPSVINYHRSNEPSVIRGTNSADFDLNVFNRSPVCDVPKSVDLKCRS